MLNSIFGNNIIGIATNGALNYAEEQQKELGMLNDVSDMLGEITGDTDRPMMPSVTLVGTKGNNDIYTSNVTVEIRINRGIEQTGAIKIHYQINDGEEQITEEDVSLEVDTEGTTTIIVWAENERGNISDKQEVSFTINKTAPSNPTISLNGTEGDNNYYKSNVGVTINAGNASNISSIKYKVEGANSIEETEVQGTTANFEITADGTSTITAYIINSAGLTSETITQEVNKDTTSPSTASIALSGEAGETSITVNANGEDSTSGIASYIFQYSTTSEKEGFTTALEVQNTANSCTYTYQGLASDTTYYLRVIVKDRAGNTLVSMTITEETEKAGMTADTLIGKVGEYVNYTSVSGNFTSQEVYNGYANQIFSTDTSLEWRILDVDVSENILTLISDTTANTGFYLADYNGYNNGVLLLNNACKAMYSNSSLGAKGRSIKIEDIEAHSSYSGASLRQFSASDRYYPNIFSKEETGAPDGTYLGSLGRSEQTEYVTGYSSGTFGAFRGKQTYYSYTMSTTYMTSIYLELFRYQAGTETNLNTYWLASRCVDWGSYASFKLFQVVDGSVAKAQYLYLSNSASLSYSADVRPIIEIDLNQVKVGTMGTGKLLDPYSIVAK